MALVTEGVGNYHYITDFFLIMHFLYVRRNSLIMTYITLKKKLIYRSFHFYNNVLFLSIVVLQYLKYFSTMSLVSMSIP